MEVKTNSAWWSDSGFWDSYGPLMFDNQRWADSVGEIDGLLALTGNPHTGRLLDTGCGPGRHSLELAKRGFEVTGIDIHQPYLDNASTQASREKYPFPPEFLCCDMRKFTTNQPFDGALNLFQSLGYFDDPEDDLLACKKIHDSLKSGGWFAVEMDGKEAAAASFQERSWMERDGRIILLESEAEAAWTRLRNRWLFRDRDGSWNEYEFSYRLYSALELGELLESAGFISVEFFGALDGRPYNQNALRLVALAQRS